MQVKGKLDELMEGNDWALIFGDDGHVKGIFIPEGKVEKDVPIEMENLLRVMGINLYEDGASVH